MCVCVCTQVFSLNVNTPFIKPLSRTDYKIMYEIRCCNEQMYPQARIGAVSLEDLNMFMTTICRIKRVSQVFWNVYGCFH